MLFSRQNAGSEKSPALITTGLVVVAVVFPLLSLVSIILRFYARRQSRAKLLSDDWWMVAAWVCDEKEKDQLLTAWFNPTPHIEFPIPFSFLMNI